MYSSNTEGISSILPSIPSVSWYSCWYSSLPDTQIFHESGASHIWIWLEQLH